jgi:hypothetical protein
MTTAELRPTDLLHAACTQLSRGAASSERFLVVLPQWQVKLWRAWQRAWPGWKTATTPPLSGARRHSRWPSAWPVMKSRQ